MRSEGKGAMTGQQIDIQIDAALRAVGQAEIPAGLAQRVASRVEQHAGASSVAQNKSSFSGWYRLLPVLGGAVAAALLLAAGLQMTLRVHEQAQQAAMSQPKTPEQTSPVSHKTSSAPTVIATKAKTFPLEKKNKPSSLRRTRHYELGSYPLTHQERLLVQLARSVNPKELQMLVGSDAQESTSADTSTTAESSLNGMPPTTLTSTITTNTINEEKSTL